MTVAVAARLPPIPARILLCAVAVLILAGLFSASRAPPEAAASARGSDDLRLYAQAVEHARAPASFYARITADQRHEGYPLKPFVTVRPPTLAFALAALPGQTARRLAMAALGLATLLAWAIRLRDLGLKPVSFALGVVVLATGVLPAVTPQAYLLHEVWAGLLIALSLALHRRKVWAVSLALGLAAALIRELAAPYLLLMAVVALTEGRRREALAWAAALAVFVAVLAAHLYAVSLNVTTADLSSQGWLTWGGWPFVLRCLQWNGLLAASPAWVTALIAPLALVGLLAWPGAIGVRLGLTVLGVVAGLLIIGRPENVYWGLLITPLVPLGLITAPRALVALARRR
jgi:hypothetical protein